MQEPKVIPEDLKNVMENYETIRAISSLKKRHNKKKAVAPVTDARLLANALRDKEAKKKKKARKAAKKTRRGK